MSKDDSLTKLYMQRIGGFCNFAVANIMMFEVVVVTSISKCGSSKRIRVWRVEVDKGNSEVQ